MEFFQLLTLPTTTANAFTSVSPAGSTDDHAKPPPRKAPRRDGQETAHSSASSASKSKSSLAGPVRITVIDYSANHATRMPSNDNIMKLLQESIGATLDPSKPQFTETYDHIYAACNLAIAQGSGERLYNHLSQALDKCVRQQRQAFIAKSTDGLNPIADFVRMCQWFETQVTLLQSLLTYLDEIYISAHSKLSHIRTLAFSFFEEHIFHHPVVTERIRASLQANINKLRTTEISALPEETVTLIRRFASHLLTHGQYQPWEDFYLSFTKSFYAEEGDSRFQADESNAIPFFTHLEARITQEQQVSEKLLPPQSWSHIRDVTEKALIGNRRKWLAYGALPVFMENIPRLARLYQLFARLQESSLLCQAFKDYMQTQVSTYVKDPALEPEMITLLTGFKKKCLLALNDAFADSPAATTSSQPSTSTVPAAIPNRYFSHAIEDAFTLGFKARRVKPAELIAKRMDELLRKGAKGDDEAFRAVVEDVLQLCRYTDDKDVFRVFYLRAFSKRLLVGKSASNDEERRVLRRLNEYDSEFENGEKMFKDLALSEELTNEFHNRLLPNQRSGMRSPSFMILQQSTWPFATPNHLVHLPQEMQDALASFNNFYKTKHQRRTLFWHYPLCTAFLTARFQEGTKELSVSLFQAIILLLFNDDSKGILSYSDIKDNVGIMRQLDDEHKTVDETELQRTLQSLACGKKRVLTKIPPGRDVKDSDSFQFNAGFSDPRAKVHINSIQAKETPEEHKRTESSIQDDRKHYLDAAIVRIMKAKKELSYEQLKTETIDAVKKHFVPQVSDIKKRIEGLVETEYIERKKSDDSGGKELNVYVYIA